MRAVLLLLASALTIIAAPTVLADPATDLKQFREYFKKQFPSVRFDTYANGPYALPGANEYRSRWDALNKLPPYDYALAEGRKEWGTRFKNGKTYSGCFINEGRNIAQHYPYWHEASGLVRTVEMDLIDCLKRNGEERPFTTADLNQDGRARNQLANLTAAFYDLSKGQRVGIDLSRPGAIQAYEAGKKYWWARRGQRNLACANCHMDLAGKNLGGEQVLSAALGHPVAWPAYRTATGQFETVHQRYANCNLEAGAKPAKHGSVEYSNLQLYETYLSSGLPLTAPAIRN